MMSTQITKVVKFIVPGRGFDGGVNIAISWKRIKFYKSSAQYGNIAKSDWKLGNLFLYSHICEKLNAWYDVQGTLYLNWEIHGQDQWFRPNGGSNNAHNENV